MRKSKHSWLAFLLILLLQSTPASAVVFQTPFVTRSEAAMILLKTRLHANIPPLSSRNKFPDVVAGAWYERYVVLAERYGILEALPQSKRIRPDDVVLRAEFLKMLVSTFGLNLNLPYLYRDVSPISWYAPYAGTAAKYALFPNDLDQTKLKANAVMTHDEVAQALFILVRQLNVETFPTLEEQELATMRKRNQLQLYERISTQQGEVTLVQSSSPTVHQPIQPKPIIRPAYEDTTMIPLLRTSIVALVNEERRIIGLKPVKNNRALQDSAQAYADAMAKEGFFGHVDPNGYTLSTRIEQSGYYKPFYDQSCFCVEHYVVGENLARGQRTAQEVMDSWMKSDSHRRAILTEEFTDLGIGINAGVWVQHFGGRKTGEVAGVK